MNKDKDVIYGVEYDHIETFYDFSPSKEDIYGLTADRTTTRSEYLERWQNVCKSGDEVVINCIADLYRFFYFKKEYAIAKKYADRIPDSNWKYFTLLNHDH